MSETGYVLIKAVGLFSNSLILLIFARVILSWIYPSQRNTLVFWVWRLTEPFLEPIRRVLPFRSGLDLSPWVALLLIYVLRTIIIRFLYTWL